jgi:hypothetical protein
MAITEAMAKGMTEQIYSSRSIFFGVRGPGLEPKAGPPIPAVDHRAVTFTLDNGRAYIRGHGYESESGFITRDEAEDIIGWLTWALRNDLCPEDHEGDPW